MKAVWQWAGIAAFMMCLAVPSPAQEPAADLTEPEILSFLEARLPAAFEVLTATRTSDPEAYRQQLQELGAQIAFYHQIRQRSPAYAESLLRAQYVTIKSQSLSRQVQNMKPGGAREVLIEELRGLLEEQFDLELQRPEMEVQQLEKEVRRLKQLIERQKQSRDAIVDMRLKAITEEKPNSSP